MDEREEGFREVASLGNVKAIQFYIKAGVDVNSRNQVNGWTALHWASKRGHSKVVQILLSNGAKTYITNNKGETPFDLAENNEIRVLLGGEPNEEPPENSLDSFKPNYLAEPDLEKSWGLPGDSVTESREKPESPKVENVKSSSSKSQSDSQTEEIFIYRKGSYENDKTLLGSININFNESIEGLIATILEEIDDVPENFKLCRISNDLQIPINKKQYGKSCTDVLKLSKDIVLIG